MFDLDSLPPLALFLAVSLAGVCHPSAGFAEELPFAAPTSVASGLSGSLGLAAADFDGDADLDLVIGAATSDSLQWLANSPGTPAPSFSASTIATLDGARGTRSADLDGDGHPDIVAVGRDSDEVVFYSNTNGDGSSWPTTPIEETLDDPYDVALADLDSDGDLDVVVAFRAAGRVDWYANDGAGGGWSRTTISSSLGDVRSLASADVDGDGDTDILTAGNGSGSGKVAWWENGPGNSWTEHVISSEPNASDVAASDLDDDGDIDVLMVAENGGGDDLRWFQNTNGVGGTWLGATIISALPTAANLDLHDLDRDGDLDVVATDGNTGTISWWENAASAASWTQHTVSTGFNGGGELLTGDIDGDGDYDILAGAATAGQVKYVQNELIHGAAEVDSAPIGTTGVFDPQQIRVDDIDGDGDPDFVYCGRGNPNSVRWLENTNGDGTAFTSHIIFTLSASNGMSDLGTADIDKDGDVDVYAVSAETHDVYWFENQGGSPPTWADTCIQCGDSSPRGMDVGDVDGDGDDDVLVASHNADRFAWYENDGAAKTTWTRHDATTGADGAHQVRGVDLDGDGDLDMVGAASRDDEVLWYRNDDGVGQTWFETSIAANIDGPGGLAVGDLDGDGDIDVIASGSTSSAVATYLGLHWFENLNGDGSGWLGHPLDTSFTSSGTEMADVDQDGDLDIVLQNSTHLRWLENTNGDATAFTNHQVLGNVGTSGGMTLADVDLDGTLDIVQADRGAVDVAQWFANSIQRLQVTAADVSPGNVEEGEVAVLFEVDVTHLGRTGDLAAEASVIQLLFEDTIGGGPMTTSELAGLVAEVAVYADDGDGLFNSASDSLLIAESPGTLAAGELTMTITPGTSGADTVFGSPEQLFVTVELSATADQQAIAIFDVTFQTGSTEYLHDGYTAPVPIAAGADESAQVVPEDGDFDGDGSPGDLDCNDGDPNIYPGATEVCDDAIDSDCDNSTVDIEAIGGTGDFDDFDNDGSPNCQDNNDDDDPVTDATDCNDFDDTIYPGASEVCDDAIDSDCDGSTTDLDDFDDTDGDLVPDCTDDDDDGDGLTDAYEDANGLDPLDPTDAAADGDLDGRDNLTEQARGTDPQVYDGPNAPTPDSPEDGGFVDSLRPVLTVDNAVSPPGDSLEYTFEVYSDEALSALVHSVTEVAELVDQTGWQVDEDLLEDTTYWWRAAAEDAFIQGPWSETWSFSIETEGDGPGVPAPVFPLTGNIVESGSEQLVWDGLTAASGADLSPQGLPLSFDVQLLQSNGLSLITEANVEGLAVAEETWDIDFAMTPGTTYSWKVRSVDAIDRTSEWSEIQFFGYDTDNNLPLAPEFISPTDGAGIVDLQPSFRLRAATDPEGGGVRHLFTLSEPEGAGAPDCDSAPGDELFSDTAEPSDEDEVRFDAPEALTEHAWYCASAQGVDVEGAEGPVVRIAFFTRGENDPPGVPDLLTPADKEITTSTPTFTVSEVTDPEGDPVSYEFVVASDRALTNELARGVVDEASFTVADAISGGAFWSVRALDDQDGASEWAAVRWFVPENPNWGSCASSAAGSASPSAWWLLLPLAAVRRRRS